MKIWKALNLKTEYTSINSCIIGLKKIIASGDKSIVFNKSIHGEFNESGEFKISLRANRYREFHFIGRMELQDGKIELKGYVEPKKRNIILLKFGVLSFLVMILFEFAKDLTQVSFLYAFSHMIRLAPSIILASIIIYAIFRLNSNIVAGRISNKILE